MKRFLIPLLAAFALPIHVNANENNGKLLASLIVGIIIEIFDKLITFYFQYQ